MPADLAMHVNEYMRARVEREDFSGAIHIARAGEVLVSQCYGLANREHNVPNTPQTKFRLASITKPFTAMAIMLLQQQGKLHVEDSIRGYLADCPPAWDEVTIHHLLNHTSGIPNFTDFTEIWGTGVFHRTVPELIAIFKDRPLDFAPGQRWNYSNSGYVLLGAIIEQVAGRSYEHFLREHIFEPLGMYDSGYDHHSTILPQRAAGYVKHDGAIFNANYIDMSIAYGGGALYSTIGDLCLWDQALYGESLISRELLAMMLAPASIAEPPGRADYGYGWKVESIFDRRCVGHGGGIFGFSTKLMRFLDERVLIVVLSNLEGPLALVIAPDLAAMVFGEPYRMPGERKAIALDPQIYDRYIGEYTFDADGRTITLTLSRDGDRLISQISGDPPVELLAESEHEFFVETFDDRFTFLVDAQGRATYVLMDMGGQVIRAGRAGG